MRSPDRGFSTVANVPKVLGTVPETENSVVPPISPVNTYGIGVTLE